MSLNQNPETVEMVRNISDHLDGIVSGKYWYCQNCDTEYLKTDSRCRFDEDDGIFLCPNCGEELYEESIGDYFNEVFGVELTITDSLEYRGCRVCIAWGGPGIWIDTMTEKVELKWWGDDAETFLSHETVKEIDEHFEEEWKQNLEWRGVRI